MSKLHATAAIARQRRPVTELTSAIELHGLAEFFDPTGFGNGIT
jgi:hypothetical protein